VGVVFSTNIWRKPAVVATAREAMPTANLDEVAVHGVRF